MYKPLVSIIIPNFNDSQYIENTINSALNQTYKNIEILVVDDGSTDNSLDIIQKFKDRIILFQQTNKGGGAARNKGLNNSKGEFIKFLDADDYLEKDAILNQVEQTMNLEIIEPDNKYIVYGEVPYIDKSGKTLYEKTIPILYGNFESDLASLVKKTIITSSPLYKTGLLREISGFNENLRANQEHDLNIRLYLKGVRFKYFDNIIYYHRKHQSEQNIGQQKRKWFQTKPLFTYELIEYYIKLFKSYNVKINGTLCLNLQKRLVSAGINVSRYGHLDLARQYLEFAKSLSVKSYILAGNDKIYLSLMFNILSKFIGIRKADLVTKSVENNINSSKRKLKGLINKK